MCTVHKYLDICVDIHNEKMSDHQPAFSMMIKWVPATISQMHIYVKSIGYFVGVSGNAFSLEEKVSPVITYSGFHFTIALVASDMKTAETFVSIPQIYFERYGNQSRIYVSIFLAPFLNDPSRFLLRVLPHLSSQSQSRNQVVFVKMMMMLRIPTAACVSKVDVDNDDVVAWTIMIMVLMMTRRAMTVAMDAASSSAFHRT